jgi:AcrR family transcriptional regulator
MARANRKADKDVSTKERILDEAERLIGLHGLDDLRLRDIAEPIGIQIPSIYGHFDGRDALRYGVAERYVTGLAQQFPYDGEGDPTEALLSGVDRFVRYLAEHPSYTRIKLRDLETPRGLPDLNVLTGGDMAENLRSGLLRQLYARVSAILERGSELGVFHKVDLIPFWRAIMGTTLVSLTWPTQDALRDDSPSSVLDRIVGEVQDLALRLVRSD